MHSLVRSHCSKLPISQTTIGGRPCTAGLLKTPSTRFRRLIAERNVQKASSVAPTLAKKKHPPRRAGGKKPPFCREPTKRERRTPTSPERPARLSQPSLSVGRSRHDFETQAREECELGFCPASMSHCHQKAPVAMSLQR